MAVYAVNAKVVSIGGVLVNKGNTVNAVNAISGFQRSFLIFSNEDGGYEGGQKPSGHIKLEVREGRGKLHAAVQNLRSGNGRFAYKLYLLKSGDSVIAAYAGQLTPEPNKAELEWSFDPRNVGESGSAFGEFDMAAVLVEYADRPGEAVICPLAAYRNRKTEWRNGLRAALMKKRLEAVAELHNEPDNEERFEKPAGMVMPEHEEFLANGLPEQQKYILQDYMPSEQTLQEQITQEQVPQEQVSQEEASPEQMQKDYMPPEQIPQQQAAQYQAAPGQIDTGCVYLNGNICGAFVNSGAGAVNPCAACHLHHGRPYYTEPPAGDVSQLREELDRYFEQCDPFHSNRSDYMWWRVGNPVNLNNLLYQCNIRSPLLFNPAVMMAHYKYRHLIVGIFQNRNKEKQYVVCGVPGMSMVDKKPFGDMSRWVQAEGNRPRYGAFGYWLVYIDPDGGKILNMNQE